MLLKKEHLLCVLLNVIVLFLHSSAQKSLSRALGIIIQALWSRTGVSKMLEFSVNSTREFEASFVPESSRVGSLESDSLNCGVRDGFLTPHFCSVFSCSIV